MARLTEKLTLAKRQLSFNKELSWDRTKNLIGASRRTYLYIYRVAGDTEYNLGYELDLTGLSTSKNFTYDNYGLSVTVTPVGTVDTTWNFDIGAFQY